MGSNTDPESISIRSKDESNSVLLTGYLRKTSRAVQAEETSRGEDPVPIDDDGPDVGEVKSNGRLKTIDDRIQMIMRLVDNIAAGNAVFEIAEKDTGGIENAGDNRRLHLTAKISKLQGQVPLFATLGSREAKNFLKLAMCVDRRHRMHP